MPSPYIKKYDKPGQPMKFQSVQELEEKIDTYFSSCLTPKLGKDNIPLLDKKDNPIYEYVKPLTLSGLAVSLGCDRKTLLNYSKKEQYFHTIKKAKSIVEEFAERKLYGNTQVAGTIFSLKNNFNWVDKHEVESTHTININTLLDELNTPLLEDNSNIIDL